ncbi:MAG: indolepyruvate ferredoxin oxidoreductase subunit alpha [Chloroflexia bacterium]|nr:indolepyruvate ferredoxin oxidoreductase subunit alpha [Chloroflexia bacterium]
MKQLLSGNEAIAQGAFEAGVKVGTAYPGTPSTEIMERLAYYPGLRTIWAPNEKVALETGLGSAYAGVRTLVAMKHVGVNVAADPFFYGSYTGIEAGLVIISADDPGMHSSQSEQDNRNYAKFARIPFLEPANSEEARDMTVLGFAISEQFDVPVMLRSTTRISHSKSALEVDPDFLPPQPEYPPYPRNPQKYVMIPAYARQRHVVVEERLKKLEAYSDETPLNRIEWGDRQLGIIASGASYTYAREVFAGASFLKLGMPFPLPRQKVLEFAAGVEKLIVIEELDPFIEEAVRLLGVEVHGGKEVFSILGEFNPDVVRAGGQKLGLLPSREEPPPPVTLPLAPRPPVLCAGCPHRGVFYVLRRLKLIVNSDIGCYTLAVLPPLATTDTMGCMGGSISMSYGSELAGRPKRAVATIGDSTFFHSGVSALLNIAYNRGRTITIVLDNGTTAMTGHQGHPGTGRGTQGEELRSIAIEDIGRAMGLKHVYVVDPHDTHELHRVLETCLEAKDACLIVARAPCVLLPQARKQIGPPYWVDPDRCNGCGLCFSLGCPAIIKTAEGKARIDPLLCNACDLCAQVCARKAIHPGNE